MTPPGGEPPRRAGYTLTILRKEADGRWRLARDAKSAERGDVTLALRAQAMRPIRRERGAESRLLASKGSQCSCKSCCRSRPRGGVGVLAYAFATRWAAILGLACRSAIRRPVATRAASADLGTSCFRQHQASAQSAATPRSARRPSSRTRSRCRPSADAHPTAIACSSLAHHMELRPTRLKRQALALPGDWPAIAAPSGSCQRATDQAG